MRAVLFVSAIALVAAQNTNEQTGTCMVDGAEAVSDALDASMFIWASIARCGKAGEVTKCEISVSSAITSVNSMVNVILAAVDKCGALNTANKECGLAVSTLTKHIGGITSSSGGIAQKCFQGAAPHGLNWNHNAPAQCVVDVKNTAKSLFKVIKSFMHLEKDQSCAKGDSNACATNALQIVGAFAGIGEYLSGAVGKCSASNSHTGSICAQQATRLVQQLTEFSERAVDVSEACKPGGSAALEASDEIPAGDDIVEEPRLYSVQGKQVGAPGLSSNMILAAFLPVTAIVGFAGGRYFGGRHVRETRQILPMSDTE